MKKKYLSLHARLLKNGLVSPDSGYDGGLCNVKIRNKPLEEDEIFSLMEPNKYCGSYWAYDGTPEKGLIAGTPHPRRYEYTPLRQNIVLLMAAMNNEL